MTSFDMLNWLSIWLENHNSKIIYLLTLILIANVIDFLIGIIIAVFNPKVKFSSSKAKLGLLIKIMIFIVLIFFIPVALLIPNDLGIYAIYILYVGILYAEIRSILGHLSIASDEKQVNLLEQFVNTIFKGDGKNGKNDDK